MARFWEGCIAVCAVAVLLAVSAAQADPQTRTWTDRGGKFTIEATFVELHDGTVGLLRSDGKRIDVSLEKLSDADAKYVHSLEAAQSPFSNMRPTKRAATGSSSDESSDNATTAPAGTFESAKALRTSTKSAKTVRPLTFAKWTFKPTSNMVSADVKLPQDAIDLGEIPNSQKFFEKVDGLYIAPDLKQAILVRQQGMVGEGKRYIQHVDLMEGRADDLIPVPGNMEVLSVWPTSGQVLLGMNHTTVTHSTQIALAKIDHNELVPLSTWKPYENEEWEPNRQIQSTRFLNGDRLMTQNLMGSAMIIWNASSAAAQLVVPLKSMAVYNWVISPDKKYMAVGSDEMIPIIDLETGTHVATINTEKLDGTARFAFSDDNHALAMIQKDCLTVWDLTTGEQLRQFNHERLLNPGSIHWIGEYLLVNGQYLFDVRHQVLLWEYSGATAQITCSGGGRIWSADTFHGQTRHNWLPPSCRKKRRWKLPPSCQVPTNCKL